MTNLLGGTNGAGCKDVLAIFSFLFEAFPRLIVGISVGPERTVDGALGVSDNLLDLTLLLEVGKGLPGEGTVDLQTVDKGGDGDEAVGLDILLKLVVGGLVEDDGVLGLVLDCSNDISAVFW